MSYSQEGVLEVRDGVSLYWNCRQPRPAARGVVVLIHGYGEHSGRYDLVTEFLSGIGFCVVAYDQRGHGRSGGRPAFVSRFDEFLDDLEIVLHKVGVEAPPGAPVILWGQSMGGLVALRYLQTRPGSVSGAVISAPWLATKIKVPWWKVALSRVLHRIVPAVRVSVELAPETLMRDPEHQRAYLDDPLVHHFVTPGLYWAVVNAQQRALADPEGVGGPVLFLVPEADQVVDPETTLRFVQRIPASATQTCRLDGLRHEPHNEPEREEVFAMVDSWFESHFPSAGES